MLNTINKTWAWTGIKAIEIININDFGNIIFRTEEDVIWRICPEKLYCEKIADSLVEYGELSTKPEFVKDWDMHSILELARESVGDLADDEKYCLKLPIILGGEYDAGNMGKILFVQLISLSGDIAKQIKDLPDGTKF